MTTPLSLPLMTPLSPPPRVRRRVSYSSFVDLYLYHILTHSFSVVIVKKSRSKQKRGKAAPVKGSAQNRADISKTLRQASAAAEASGQIVTVQGAALRSLTRDEHGNSRLQKIRLKAVRARAQPSSFFELGRRDQVRFIKDLFRVGEGNHIRVFYGQDLAEEFGFEDYEKEQKDKRRICDTNPEGLCTTTFYAKSQLAQYLRYAGCKVVTPRNKDYMDIFHIALHGGPSGHDDAGKIRRLSCTNMGSGVHVAVMCMITSKLLVLPR